MKKGLGCGLEITLLAAIPAGSGLGTSSILAATVLGSISDFCGLGWDKAMIGNRTLVLEQLLTTGGGWQDQFGGVLHGLKLLQTSDGFNQNPQVRWLPEYLLQIRNTNLAISFIIQALPVWQRVSWKRLSKGCS